MSIKHLGQTNDTRSKFLISLGLFLSMVTCGAVLPNFYANAESPITAEILSERTVSDLGPNIALSSLGASVTASSEYDDFRSARRLIDGYSVFQRHDDHRVCANCGWFTRNGDTRREIIVDLPTSRSVSVQAVIIDTRMFIERNDTKDKVLNRLPKRIEVSVSDQANSVGFETIMKATLKREFARQVVRLPEGSSARFVKVRVLESFGWPTGVSFAEIEVREQPGIPQSVLADVSVNIAHPGLGGSIVTYTGYNRDWPVHRLFDGDLSTSWVSADATFPQDFTIAFNNGQLAEIDRLQISLDQAPGEISWPTTVVVEASKSNSLDGFVEIGRHAIERRSGTQSFPIDESARFLRLRIEDNNGATNTTISEIEVIESNRVGYKSILLNAESGENHEEESTAGRQPIVQTFEAEPNDTLIQANTLGLDTAIEGKIDPLGEFDYFELPDLGNDATALTLDYTGVPNIRHGLELLDGKGRTLHAFDPGGVADNRAQLTFDIRGDEKFLRLSEPPSSVVVIWDTSGSMEGNEVDLERAVKEYIRLAPENQSIQLMRFESEVKTIGTFTSNKARLLEMADGEFWPNGGTSLYDAISTAISLLRDRAGNRAIVVMTDGADSTSDTWYQKVWTQIANDKIRVYSIGLGSSLDKYSSKFGATGKQTLTHLSEGVNGESFFAVDSNALKDFYSRIAFELTSPATYVIEPKVERGSGMIRLVSNGEQVPTPAMPDLHLIFDVSGSMAYKMPSGESRMKVGIEAWIEASKSIPSDAPFTLTLFGHRLIEDEDPVRACTDIETIHQGTVPRNLNEFLWSLNPRYGTTPLTAAIEHAVKSFKGKDGGVIVVITDGDDECDRTPHETMKRLMTEGLDELNLNIIGFDVDNPSIKDSLRKMAELAEGNFFDASNGGGLAESLRQAISAPYRVLDSADQIVVEGKIGGPAQETPPGYYDVEIIAADGPRRKRGVRIDADRLTTLTVNKVGRDMNISVGRPEVFNELHECGLAAIRSGRSGLEKRIQEKLNRLGFSVGTVDGDVGPNTLRQIDLFLSAYQIIETSEDLLPIEQHLDCVLAHGKPWQPEAPEQKFAALNPSVERTDFPEIVVPKYAAAGIPVPTLGMKVAAIATPDPSLTGQNSGVKGVLVAEVSPDSYAAKKGIQAGDFIVEILQKPVLDAFEINLSIEAFKSTGNKAVLLLVARNEELRFVVLQPDFSVDLLELESGASYRGQLDQSRQNGQGVYFAPDGYTYSGEWNDGVIQGHGAVNFPDGTIYEGEFKSGLPHGIGKITYWNGATYVGEVREGKPNGVGRSELKDGSLYEGEMRNGLFHGFGQMTRADGMVQQGQWADGAFVK